MSNDFYSYFKISCNTSRKKLILFDKIIYVVISKLSKQESQSISKKTPTYELIFLIFLFKLNILFTKKVRNRNNYAHFFISTLKKVGSSSKNN